jgi:mycofactocin precursor
MDTDVIEAAVPATVTGGQADGEADDQATPEELTADDLIEEVSIDGMCGVY